MCISNSKAGWAAAVEEDDKCRCGSFVEVGSHQRRVLQRDNISVAEKIRL
jgi:hypothetical protein